MLEQKEFDIEKEYNEVRKKYGLPEYSQLNNEFEISCIDKEEFILRQIRRKIVEKMEFFSDILEGILQPDTASLAEMYECRIFDDDEKSKAMHIFKRLMLIQKESIEAAVENSQQLNADFINKSFKEWLSLKKDLKQIIKKIIESWGKESEMEEKLGYFG